MVNLDKNRTFLAEGRLSHVYQLENKQVLKLMHNSVPVEKVDDEFRRCRIIEKAGVPSPKAFERVEIDDRQGIIFEWAGDNDLMNAKLSNPLNVPSGGRFMASVHLEMLNREAPDLPDIKDVLKKMIFELPAEVMNSNQLSGFKTYLDHLPDGDNICHMDFHPGNIILNGKDYQIIDWSEVIKGAPQADIAMTSLILSMAETAPGTNLLLRMLIPIFRKMFERHYKKALLSAAVHITEESIRKWLLAIAVARMAMWQLESEREFLTELIQAELQAYSRL